MRKKLIFLYVVIVIAFQIMGCRYDGGLKEQGITYIVIEPDDKKEIQEDMRKQIDDYENDNNAESLYRIMHHLSYNNLNGELDEYAYKYYCEFFGRIFTDKELQDLYETEADEWKYYNILHKYLMGVYEDENKDWKEEINRIESKGENKDYLLRGIGYFVLDTSGKKRDITGCEIYLTDDDKEYCLNLMLEYERKYKYLENEGCYVIILTSIEHLYGELGNEEQAQVYGQKGDEWRDNN